MRPYSRLAILCGAVLLISAAGAARSTKDADLGLSKTSVFSTPVPAAAAPAGKEPGESRPEAPYFEGIPPAVPHAVEPFLPLTIGGNMCLDCHDVPEMAGKTVEPGEPPPIPSSHYVDLRRSPGQAGKRLVGARFVCTQCHARMTSATPLVGNTYRP